ETQRKDLRDLQAFKDLVFQSVGTGLIALDRDHRITAFNRAAEEIAGRSAPETIGRPWTALFGDSVPLPEIDATIERNPRGCTQRKARLALQPFKGLVFQSVGTGLIALDRDHRITAFNRAAEEIAGRSAPETIGRPWTALFGDSVPLPEIEATIERNPRASTRHETLLRRPDGTAVPVRLTFSALRSGEGDRLGLIGACDDLSAIRAMEARMRQADRLATLGRLAANIAHEIRNPLASLTGAIEVLTSTAAAGDARERLSQIVMRESERLNQIITNFLEYARPAPLAVEAVDVADALE